MHKKADQPRKTQVKMPDLIPKKDAKGGATKQDPGKYINPDGTTNRP